MTKVTKGEIHKLVGPSSMNEGRASPGPRCFTGTSTSAPWFNEPHLYKFLGMGMPKVKKDSKKAILA